LKTKSTQQTQHNKANPNQPKSKYKIMDVMDQREGFAIQSSILMAELQEMLEKTKKLETMLIQEDTFVPLKLTQELQPPKKR